MSRSSCLKNMYLVRTGFVRNTRINGYLKLYHFRMLPCRVFKVFHAHSCLRFPVSLSGGKHRGSETKESVYPISPLRFITPWDSARSPGEHVGTQVTAALLSSQEATCTLCIESQTQVSCESAHLILGCRFRFLAGWGWVTGGRVSVMG